MIDRDRYMPGVPCWVDTDQPDPQAAIEFYGGLFGWVFDERSPGGMSGSYYVAQVRGRDVAGVGTKSKDAERPTAWNTYVSVESADEGARKVKEEGGSVLTDAFDIAGAGRMAVVADRQGAAFSLWQPEGMIGAQLVNEPGTLNFNELNTRDPEDAKSFYGRVFGWETLGLDGGFTMWTLPGYGDHLEERDPELRKRMAETGAPAGFEDVVASLNPIPVDQSQVRPHWSATFAVDDADAVAERAAELGGQVIVPPFDAPWVRMTVITDPQGATFTASKFVPENRSLAEEADAAISGS
jgi:predicted enzyme related to lactoylglutathione lyase